MSISSKMAVLILVWNVAIRDLVTVSSQFSHYTHNGKGSQKILSYKWKRSITVSKKKNKTQYQRLSKFNAFGISCFWKMIIEIIGEGYKWFIENSYRQMSQNRCFNSKSNYCSRRISRPWKLSIQRKKNVCWHRTATWQGQSNLCCFAVRNDNKQTKKTRIFVLEICIW